MTDVSLFKFKQAVATRFPQLQYFQSHLGHRDPYSMVSAYMLARDRLFSTAQSRDIPLMCVCVVKNAVQ